jgi:peroxiredoxin
VTRGAQVVAVLAQRSEKVKRYVEGSGLPFHVLVDDAREVLRAYGVWHRLGFDAWNIAHPALFLIDRVGVVHAVFVSDAQHEFPDHETITGAIERIR